MPDDSRIVPLTWDGTPDGDPVTWGDEPLYGPEGFSCQAFFGGLAAELVMTR